MEHFWNWLMVLMDKAHIPFIAGLYVAAKSQNKNRGFDLGDMGDNVPYIFLK